MYLLIYEPYLTFRYARYVIYYSRPVLSFLEESAASVLRAEGLLN